MKRLSPAERSNIVNAIIKKMKEDLQPRFGGWNQQKLLDELEKKLRAERQARNKAKKTPKRPAL